MKHKCTFTSIVKASQMYKIRFVKGKCFLGVVMPRMEFARIDRTFANILNC